MNRSSISKLTLFLLFFCGLAVQAFAGEWKWIAYGDTRSKDEGHRAVLQSMVNNTPDYRFIISTGDVVNKGDLQSDWDIWQKAVNDVLGGTGQNQFPPKYIAAPGNHDRTNNSAGLANWKKYLPGQAQQFGNDGRFFVFDYENARFVILDSENMPATGAQKDLLLQAIKNNPQTWLFVFWHAPIFDFGEKEYRGELHTNWGIPVYENGGDIIFTGHAHYYVRGKKLALNGQMNPPVDNQRGVAQVVTGTGGAPTDPVKVDTDGNAYMVESHTSEYSYTELTVNGNTMRLRQINTSGKVIDEAVYTANPKNGSVPTPTPVTALTMVSGNNQSAEVGATLQPFVVKTFDGSNNPVSGKTIQFQITSGAGTLSNSQATTASNGLASTTLTLGNSAGKVTVTASGSGLSGSPITFTATATAPLPEPVVAAKILRISGTGQVAKVGTTLPDPFVIEVQDNSGKPVAGVTVYFDINYGSGSLSNHQQTTNSNGRASTTLTLSNTPGEVIVSASADGLSGSPINFNATAEANGASDSTPGPAPGPIVSKGIWISADEIMKLPTSGAAWEALKKVAYSDFGRAKGGHDDTHDSYTLAQALVAVRLNDNALRARTAENILSAIGTEDNGNVLSLARNLTAYVCAADIIGLKNFDPGKDAQFRSWIANVRHKELGGQGTLISIHEKRPNNFGTHATAARASVAIYLGESSELERTAKIFKGWMGDRSSYSGYTYGSLDWQADPSNPVGINPKGSTKQGHSIDGVLPDDQRRGGGFKWPPPHENYVYGALQGALAAANILNRAGYDTWNWQDQAMLRAYKWLHEQANFSPGGDDVWQLPMVDYIYGTNYWNGSLVGCGKNMGWTDWTHAKRSQGPAPAPTPKTYILTETIFPVNGGSVTRVPDKSSYTAGESVKMTASSANGYQFNGWTGDIGSANAASPSITVTMDRDRAVTANFKSASTISAPDIDVSPLSYDFGNVALGANSSRNIALLNTGNANLEIKSITLDGVNKTEFTLNSVTTPFTLNPNATREVAVIFNPASGGTKSVNLVIASNDPDENPVTVKITGAGSVSNPPDDVSGEVSPTFSTAPTAGNADDPAIWIHPTDPAKSIIIGTDKDAGIFVWDISGKQLQQIPQGTATNNVDVRYGFKLGGQSVDIVAANLRDAGKLAVFKINPNYSGGNVLTQIADVKSANNSIQKDSYGFALYRRPSDGSMYVFDRPKGGGVVRQYRIEDDGTGNGVKVSPVRDLNYKGGTAEGFVADDEHGYLYVTEEAKGIHKFYADPGKSADPISLFATGDGTVSDREGVGIYACSNGSGYLLLSSQGNSTIKIYDRGGNNAFLKTIVAKDDKGKGGLGTDGLDVTANSTPNFPNGFVVVHDEAASRFHLYNWNAFAGSDLNSCGGGRNNPTPAPEYTLNVTVNPNGGGRVLFKPEKPKYSGGETVELTAVAENGYQFMNWTGDFGYSAPSLSLNPLPVVMDKDRKITANFTLIGGSDIVVNPSYDFGNVAVGRAAKTTIAVRNNGSVKVVVSETNLSGSHEFAIENGGGFTLDPGQTRDLICVFAPTSAGAKQAKLQLVCKEPAAKTVEVALSGNGAKEEPSGSESGYIVLKPTDDTYVRSANRRKSYGKQKFIALREASLSMTGYIKFVVPGSVSGISKAILRLFVEDPSRDNARLYVGSNNYKDSDAPWTENEMTWENAPDVSGEPAVTFGPHSRGTWVEVDVTSLVPGAGAYSFVIVSDSKDRIKYSSKEGKNAPELALEAVYAQVAAKGSERGHNGSAVEDAPMPTEFQLEQNYPNPFNPSTTIAFSMPKTGEVKLAIYNMLGQLVATLVDGEVKAGHHKIVWDGRDAKGRAVATGAYVYRFETGDFVASRKLVLTK